ncbi:MAG: hypothetical protein M3R08_03250 [Bacteroidota bacterium]|nr:hypothetical protein [Bacteroidota bacterium]
MERSTRFLSLSGLSGVIAGSLALIGALIAQRYLRLHEVASSDPRSSYDHAGASVYWDHVAFLASLAIATLILSLAGAVWFTWRRSARTGEKMWDRSAKRFLVNLLIPLACGGIFCIALVSHGSPALVPAATLIFYGLALLNASKYTLDEVRWVGISELILGSLAAFWIGAGLMFWALGFGVLHIFYGLLMYMRHERKAVEEQ